MARIVIIEDDGAIRQSVDYALKHTGHHTLALEVGSGAIERISQFEPDLIILDLMLPGMTGLDIAEAIRTRDQTTAIIMISALDQERDIITGLALGADDYVTKPFSLDELLARVDANLRRVEASHSGEDNSPLVIGDLSIDPSINHVTIAGQAVSLRPKEYLLLFALARSGATPLSRERLAQEVWGYDYLPSSRTIDVHIRRLRALIAQKSAYRYIQTVHGKGYRFVPEKIEEDRL